MSGLDQVLPTAGPALTVGGTIFGVWLVLRLISKFQEDFTERYRVELTAERGRRAIAEERETIEREAKERAQAEAARLRRRLIELGESDR